MDQKSPKLSRFAERFQMEVRSGRSVRRRIANALLPPSFDDMHIHQYSLNVIDVPCYDVTVPEDKFEELADTMEFFDNQSHKHVHAMQVLEQARADERIRQDNPAVQKAWMRYLMLLEIARK